MHQVGAAYALRFGHLCGIDRVQLVHGGFIQAAQEDGWEGRSELLRMQEGKEDRLAPILGNVLGGGNFAALGRDESVERTSLHRVAHPLVIGDEPGRRLHFVRCPLIEISTHP